MNVNTENEHILELIIILIIFVTAFVIAVNTRKKHVREPSSMI